MSWIEYDHETDAMNRKLAMYFDRYDIATAYNLLAHDYGLYDVKTRLNNMGFKSSHEEEFYSGLTENAQAIYNHQASLLDGNNSTIRSEFK